MMSHFSGVVTTQRCGKPSCAGRIKLAPHCEKLANDLCLGNFGPSQLHVARELSYKKAQRSETGLELRNDLLGKGLHGGYIDDFKRISIQHAVVEMPPHFVHHSEHRDICLSRPSRCAH